MNASGSGPSWMKRLEGIVGVRRHLARAWRRLIPPSQARIGDITVCIDPRMMPKSVIRAILRGDYELPERNAVVRIVRPGDRVAEFGGGIGIVSMTAASIAGPGKVHVFEPQQVACDLISRNAMLNGLEIACSKVAVARESGTRKFWTTSNIISSNLFGGRTDGKGQTATVEVETIAVDEILRVHQPNVLIVDIEGAEVEVFGECDLAAIEVIVIEMHPHIVGIEPIVALEEHFCSQGLRSIPDLSSGNSQVFTRGRQPFF